MQLCSLLCALLLGAEAAAPIPANVAARLGQPNASRLGQVSVRQPSLAHTLNDTDKGFPNGTRLEPDSWTMFLQGRMETPLRDNIEVAVSYLHFRNHRKQLDESSKRWPMVPQLEADGNDPPPTLDVESNGNAATTLNVGSWNIAAVNQNPFEYWSDDEELGLLMKHVKAVMDEWERDGKTVGGVLPDAQVKQLLELKSRSGQAVFPEKVTLTEDKVDVPQQTWKPSKVTAEMVTVVNAAGGEPNAVDYVRQLWNTFKSQPVVSGFLKEKDWGTKRLVSQIDMASNTATVTGLAGTFYRPTVINCYKSGDGDPPDLKALFGLVEGDGPDELIEKWFPVWLEQMETIFTSADFKDVPSAKYTDLSPGEEKVSKPLSALALAVFDASFLRIMEEAGKRLKAERAAFVEEAGKRLKAERAAFVDFHDTRRRLCRDQMSKKGENTLAVLQQYLAPSGGSHAAPDVPVDVMFLQEVAKSDFATFRQAFEGSYHVIGDATKEGQASPALGKKNQNSMIMLRREAFPDAVQIESKTDVMKADLFDESKDKWKIDDGDLCLALATHTASKTTYLLASYHGDTNGKQTIATLNAVLKRKIALDTEGKSHRLLFGLDANTYYNPKNDRTQGVADWVKHFKAKDLESSWGTDPVGLEFFTTRTMRTPAQAQLAKQVTLEMSQSDQGPPPTNNKFVRMVPFSSVQFDKSPKDYVLFEADHLVPEYTTEQNMEMRGAGYDEAIPFPTFEFPSDHGVLFTQLIARSDGKKTQPTMQKEYSHASKVVLRFKLKN